MGLLDDAIREHLELKRRHGADPDEVARQESEALGDPRAPEPDPEPDAPGEPGPADEVMPVTPGEDATLVAEPDDAAAVAAGEDEPEPAATTAQPPAEEPWLEDEPPPREPPPPAPSREPDSAAGAGGEQPPTDEDVLEETPDFLQETPEHDRLWFEQKPPRDFDFDN